MDANLLEGSLIEWDSIAVTDWRKRMAYTAEDINRLIAAPHEHENLEFKKAKEQFDTGDLYRYCVALANEGGGKLLLGVTDKPPRIVVGTNAYLELNKLKGQIHDKLTFRVDVDEVTHPDGRVLLFTIPSRPAGTAYTYEGAYLMRVGDSLRPMSEDQLRRIFAEGKQDFFLRPAVTNLDDDGVQNLLDIPSFFSIRRLPYPTTLTSALQRFEHERFVTRHGSWWNISNIGALLFAKDLGKFELQRKAPRVTVYQGIDKLNIIRDQIGNKGYAVGFQGLVDYINNQLPANELIKRVFRATTRMYPEDAVRELVANALIHQDFEDLGSFVTVEIFTDRVEITNPGEPLIRTDHFINGNRSRNELLTDIMRQLGICEELGTGIDRVIGLAEVYQLPAPDFRVLGNQTKVVLFAHKPFREMDRGERVRACYQHTCLRYVNNNKMTNQSLRERFKQPANRADTISKIISDAVAEGCIKIDDPENRSKKFAKYVPSWA